MTSLYHIVKPLLLLPCLSNPWTMQSWPWALSCHARASAFLLAAGDFWHARGALPVAALNSVLKEFQDWTQPTLMLVGNHDQAGFPVAPMPVTTSLHATSIVHCSQASLKSVAV